MEQGKPVPTSQQRGGSGPGSLQQWYHAYGEDGVHEAVQRYAAEYPQGEVSVQWNPGDYDSKIVTALQNSSVGRSRLSCATTWMRFFVVSVDTDVELSADV